MRCSKLHIGKRLLYLAIFGDSLVEKVFPKRDKLKDQVLCIIIQSIFVFVVCLPLALILFLFLLVALQTDNFKVFIYIYLFLSLTFMVPIILNLDNTKYSFPKSLINIYFVFKTVSIKRLRTFLNIVLISFIVYFLFILISKILSYYPQLQRNYPLWGYIIFIQILMMLYLESTLDEFKRALRQFYFWLVVFIIFLIFTFTQLGLYILPKLDDENALNAIIILIGITFNLAQVLSSGREVYRLAMEKINRDGLIELAYEEAFTYMKMLKIIEEYRNTQKELFYEIMKEIKSIGFRRFIIKMAPFILIALGSLIILTVLQIYSDNIGHFFQSAIDFIVKK